jgi:hypothetical protein
VKVTKAASPLDYSTERLTTGENQPTDALAN